MKRGPKQDEFDALIHQALTLMDEDQAFGSVLVASHGEDGIDVNFAGNSEGSEALDAIGYQLGQTIAHDPAMGHLIIDAQRRGVEDHRDGKVLVKVVTPTPTTKH